MNDFLNNWNSNLIPINGKWTGTVARTIDKMKNVGNGRGITLNKLQKKWNIPNFCPHEGGIVLLALLGLLERHSGLHPTPPSFSVGISMIRSMHRSHILETFVAFDAFLFSTAILRFCQHLIAKMFDKIFQSIFVSLFTSSGRYGVLYHKCTKLVLKRIEASRKNTIVGIDPTNVHLRDLCFL
jgi:hypothetical protein